MRTTLDPPVPSGSRYRTGGLFAVAGMLFGGTFVAVEVGLAYLPPLLFLALRFDIAAAVLLPYVYLRTDTWRPRTRRDIWGIAAGTFAIGLTNTLLFIGQQYITSGVAAIIFSLAPVLTPGFALVLLSDEHLSLRGFGGLVLGLLGVGLVIRPNLAHLFAGNLTGRLILLAAAINIALGTVLIRRADPTVPSLTLVAWALPLSALLIHAASLATGTSLAAGEWTLTVVAALVYVGFGSAAIGYVAYFELLDTVGAIKANSLNYFVPIVAAVAGWALLGQTLTVLTLVGFGVIILGFVVLEYSTLVEELPHSWRFSKR